MRCQTSFKKSFAAPVAGGLVLALVWVSGADEAAAEDRIAVEREAEEYFRYHERMRGFQQALRDILEDALDGDMEAVEAHALEAVPGGSPTEEGAQEQQGEPTEEEESRREARREATPRAFQGMMQETHGQFRNLAQDARELGDPAHTKRQLVGIQDVCVSCHSAYRFEKR